MEMNKKKAVSELFTVKIKKLPYCCKKKHLKAFFLPLKPVSIRIPRGNKGIAYVGFSEGKDVKKALIKSRGFLEGHRVDVVECHKKTEQNITQEYVKEVESQAEDASKLIAESGRLFVRNLGFSVTVEELKELFSKYGPVAEIHIPTDFHTKLGVGYAFVSYLFAEHAVEAYTKLDGAIFQGRLLHIIPGKPKKEIILDPKEMTFKQKKAAKVKSLSHSSHNWNSLFLGTDAVADVIAEKYNVPKDDVLSNEKRDSVAVRMALAETQLVLETRQFLIRHGVKLDAFSQPAAECSKTTILIKNLPPRTTSEDLLSVCSRHGAVKEVILPPAGMTALVEFSVAAEAKTAFSRLAYSRFMNKPLYLEWAPTDVFDDETKKDDDAVKHFSTCGPLHSVSISRKKDLKSETMKRKKSKVTKQETSKICVRNIPFGATPKEIKSLFQEFGELKFVRLPKKTDGTDGHRGFGFVDFVDKNCAKRAFEALCHSTHILGRRLVLEWASLETEKLSDLRTKTTREYYRSSV